MNLINLRLLTPMVLSTAAFTLLAACSADEAAPGQEPGRDLPNASASAVWSFLQDVEYEKNWELWPDTESLFVGSEPHGELHTVYVSPNGSDALGQSGDLMPTGTLIIKQNYSADAVLDNLTIMYKVSGYDTENNDWFWAMLGADGDVRREGKLEGCQQCHGARRDNDFIWIGDLR